MGMAIIVATIVVINMATVGRLAAATGTGMGMDTKTAHLRMVIKRGRRMARVMADIRIASAPERPHSLSLAPRRS